MFELEILELLKKLKTTTDEYQIIKIKKSIFNLIKENPQKFEKFTQMQALDTQTLKLINECELVETEEDQNKINETSDVETIKQYYSKWLEIYQKNNNIPNNQNEKIVMDIINFYVHNRIEILLQILKINEDDNFEAFKNMLRNYLRKYFAEKINNYYNSEKYTSLGFFEKRKKTNKLLEITEEIGSYIFNYKKIEETLN